jgi:hypothetical protein
VCVAQDRTPCTDLAPPPPPPCCLPLPCPSASVCCTLVSCVGKWVLVNAWHGALWVFLRCWLGGVSRCTCTRLGHPPAPQTLPPPSQLTKLQVQRVDMKLLWTSAAVALLAASGLVSAAGMWMAGGATSSVDVEGFGLPLHCPTPPHPSHPFSTRLPMFLSGLCTLRLSAGGLAFQRERCLLLLVCGGVVCGDYLAQRSTSKPPSPPPPPPPH